MREIVQTLIYEHKHTQRRLAVAGFVVLGVGFFLQIAAQLVR